MKRAAIGIALLLVAILGGVLLTVTGAKPNDAQLIREALDRSIKASREGRPGGVVDLLSRQLKFNEQEMSGNVGQIAQFIREQRPDLTVERVEPLVTGDEARVTSPVTLKLGFLGQSRDFRIKEVTLVFKKEASRRWLIIPDHKWSLSEVRAVDFSPTEFSL